jgi:hypothetical protein
MLASINREELWANITIKEERESPGINLVYGTILNKGMTLLRENIEGL